MENNNINDDSSFDGNSHADDVSNNSTENTYESKIVRQHTGQIKQSLSDLLYGIIVKPVETLRYMAAEKQWVKGMLVYIVVSWVTTIASLPSQLEQFKQLETLGGANNFNLGPAIILSIIFLSPFLFAIGLIIMGGIYHLLAKLLKGQGEFKGIIASLGLSSFPGILITPFYLLYLIGGSVAELIALALTLSASLAFGLWVMILNVLAIRENYRLSTARAIGVFLIPIAAILILAILLIVLVVALIMASMPQA